MPTGWSFNETEHIPSRSKLCYSILDITAGADDSGGAATPRITRSVSGMRPTLTRTGWKRTSVPVQGWGAVQLAGFSHSEWSNIRGGAQRSPCARSSDNASNSVSSPGMERTCDEEKRPLQGLLHERPGFGSAIRSWLWQIAFMGYRLVGRLPK
jgi:hypothetical protein